MKNFIFIHYLLIIENSNNIAFHHRGKNIISSLYLLFCNNFIFFDREMKLYFLYNPYNINEKIMKNFIFIHYLLIIENSNNIAFHHRGKNIISSLYLLFCNNFIFFCNIFITYIFI